MLARPKRNKHSQIPRTKRVWQKVYFADVNFYFQNENEIFMTSRRQSKRSPTLTAICTMHSPKVKKKKKYKKSIRCTKVQAGAAFSYMRHALPSAEHNEYIMQFDFNANWHFPGNSRCNLNPITLNACACKFN